jgi:hypothetical protein
MLADRLAASIGIAAVVLDAPILAGSLCHQPLLSSADLRLAEHPTPVTSTGSSRNDRTRFVVAAIGGAVGLVWLLQGLGVLPGSFMSGDPMWGVAGVVVIVAALAYAAWPRLRSR